MSVGCWVCHWTGWVKRVPCTCNPDRSGHPLIAHIDPDKFHEMGQE